jgi:hypothetical protein
VRKIMTITIRLSPETEVKLRQCAAQTDQTVEQFVERLVERVVHRVNGGQPSDTATAVHGTLPSDEALAPFRRDVAESGMTDEELLEFFEEMREEVYREKQGRLSKTS